MSKSGYLFAEQIAIYFSSLKSCGKQNIISASPHPAKDAHILIFEAHDGILCGKGTLLI